MPSVKIQTPKEFADFIGNIRLEEAMMRGIKSAAKLSIVLIHLEVDRAIPASPDGRVGAFNTGAYKRAWKTEHFNDHSVVYNEKPYAAVIEKGRRRGGKFPNIGGLEKWARKRLGVSSKEAKVIAWPIAKEIHRRGLRGRKVLEKSIPRIVDTVEQEVWHELMKELTG